MSVTLRTNRSHETPELTILFVKWICSRKKCDVQQVRAGGGGDVDSNLHRKSFRIPNQKGNQIYQGLFRFCQSIFLFQNPKFFCALPRRVVQALSSPLTRKLLSPHHPILPKVFFTHRLQRNLKKNLRWSWNGTIRKHGFPDDYILFLDSTSCNKAFQTTAQVIRELRSNIILNEFCGCG